MFDLAAFTLQLFQCRRKRNKDVGAQTHRAGPEGGVELCSSRAGQPVPTSPLLSLWERPWGQGHFRVSKCPAGENQPCPRTPPPSQLWHGPSREQQQHVPVPSPQPP